VRFNRTSALYFAVHGRTVASAPCLYLALLLRAPPPHILALWLMSRSLNTWLLRC